MAKLSSDNQAEFSNASLEELVEGLSSGSRRDRQISATALANISRKDAEALVPHVASLQDALNRKEARTRWECLDALCNIGAKDPETVVGVLDDAEESLFDESNGPVRLAAFRLFCLVGASSVQRSIMVWPIIDEAIQCYHGDEEFMDMLNAVAAFAGQDIDPEVKSQLGARMAFDSQNSKGALKKKAQQIIDIVSL